MLHKLAGWSVTLAVVATTLGSAGPVLAGIKKDLKSCTAGRNKKSAHACTRVLKSGRLPKRQRYIAYYNRGWSYRNGGDTKRAIRDFTTALKLNGRFADSYYSRSVAYYDRGDLDRSLEDLEIYVKKKGKSWAVYYKRALMLRRMNKLDEALVDLDEAAELKPAEGKVKTLRALVLSDRGNHDAGLAELKPVLVKRPKDATALNARATILFRQKRFEEALVDADKAIKARRSFAPAHVLKGQILEETKKAELAKSSYRIARNYSGVSVEGLFAGKLAVERLTAMKGTKNEIVVPAPSAAPKRPATTKSARSTCKRFVPTANTTISVDCGT